MKAIEQLLKRVLPRHSDQFALEYIDAADGRDVYEIEAVGGRIVLRGNDNGSLALALGRYLRDTAKVNLSWCGSDLTLPEILPISAYTRQVVEQKYRVYMNYCTFNYSASWWDFDRWEREIDLMALSGINMPLCAVGIEGIWYHTLLEFGFSDEEARSFIAGPAFLAWQHMGNLENFGGPVSRAWLDRRIELGKKIIDRVVSLGMHPIQQGFAGCIPTAFQKKYPESRIALKEAWCGMQSTAQLDPTDPLFMVLGKKFMEVQEKLFGLHGFYAADPFHESKAPVDTIEYLNQVGRVITRLYDEVDPNYTWVMQTWTICKPIIDMIPQDKLLLLDLTGERYLAAESFWGYPFVVGSLHNFGGRTFLTGNVRRLAGNPYTVARAQGGNVVGTGLFMEAIEQTPVYYDLAFDMLTRSDTVDMNEWIRDYIERRYKTNDENAVKAWQILLDNVYTEKSEDSSSIICARPAVNVKKSGPNCGFSFYYDNRELEKAIHCLLKVNSKTEGYGYDLMDVTRQYLCNYAYDLYGRVSRSFTDKDKEGFASLSDGFLNLLSDIDLLLSHRDELSLERWITDARKCAAIPEEEDLFEYNASALVTIWGEDENPEIFDYSWREWSGLIEQYYKMRWSFFFDKLKGFLERGEEYREEDLPLTLGREAWRANDLYAEMAEKEIAWIHGRKTFAEKNTGSLSDFVIMLMQKYPIE